MTSDHHFDNLDLLEVIEAGSLYPNPHPEIPSFKCIFDSGLPQREACHFASWGQEFVSEFPDRNVLSG